MDKQELINALSEHIDLVTLPLTGNRYIEGKLIAFKTALSLVNKLNDSEDELAYKIKVLTNLEPDEFLRQLAKFGLALEEGLPNITDEQAWNKIAEAYPETAQSLRIALDHAVFGQEAEPQKVKARLAKHWDEDLGECLWWNYPIEEPPYCGTPLDDEFPKYKTHFTELRIPNEVEEEPEYLIRVNDMYFLNWGEDGTCPTFVLDDMPGSIAQARKHSKAAAEELAKHLGGTVEKV